MYTIGEIAQDIREKNLSDEQLYKKYGGFKIYIPKVMPNYEEKVIAEFNGYNQAALATRYNVSINTIYTIIRKSKPKIKQSALF